MLFSSMDQAVAFIYRSFLRAKPNLASTLDSKTRHPEYIRQILNRLDGPDRGKRIVLVTGSKGKGSTSRLIAALLTGAGYKVGLFTSPHLVHFTERIRVNGQAIPDDRFLAMLSRVAPLVEEIDRGLPADHYIGPVGITLAVAMLYFAEQETDVDVVECGRGGRFDDANVLTAEFAVITPVMYEHPQNLGPTLQDIAWNKAGIIKPGVKGVFSGRQTALVEETIRRACEKLGVPLALLGQDFGADGVEIGLSGTDGEFFTNTRRYGRLTLPLLGAFQADNAALALAAAERIVPQITEEQVRRSFSQVQWPGRCEIIGRRPLTLLDGAINRESAQFVADIVKKMGVTPVIAVVGVPADKDYGGVLAVMASVSQGLIVTQARTLHLHFPEDAFNIAQSLHPRVEEIRDLVKAYRRASELAGPGGMVVLVGTQSLIGEAKGMLGQDIRNLL